MSFKDQKRSFNNRFVNRQLSDSNFDWKVPGSGQARETFSQSTNFMSPNRDYISSGTDRPKGSRESYPTRDVSYNTQSTFGVPSRDPVTSQNYSHSHEPSGSWKTGWKKKFKPIGLFLWGFPDSVKVKDLLDTFSVFGELVNGKSSDTNFLNQN